MFAFTGSNLRTFVSKPLFPVSIIMTAVCCLAAWAVWSIANSRSSAKLHRAENSLRLEIDRRLPLGSDKTSVSQFLETHAISSDGYRRLNAEYRPLYKGAFGIMVAYTEKIDTPIFLCRIVVTFRFNDSDKLEGYDDSFVCNGPF